MTLFINVPSPWNYSTIDVPMVENMSVTGLIWGNSYHVYHSTASSSMWNNYRSCRILLHELIINTVETMDLNVTDDTSFRQRKALAEQSRQIARQLVEDICASVPFHFGIQPEDEGEVALPLIPGNKGHIGAAEGNSTPGSRTTHDEFSPGECLQLDGEMSYPSFIPTPNPTSPKARDFGSSTSFQITGAGGLTIMWPLLIAANSGLASSQLRQWITFCLDKVGYSMGINQALSMAQLLRKGMRTRAWPTPDFDSPQTAESTVEGLEQ
jgi:hypothetical protein